MRRFGHAIVAALCFCAAGLAPRARSDEFASRLAIFADSENNYVLTGATQFRAPLAERFDFGTRLLVDGVSGASTKAGDDVEDAYIGGYSNRKRHLYEFSQPNWLRQRYELSGFGDARHGEWEESGGYIYSYENVYESHTAWGSIRRHLWQRNSTASATYFHNFDTVNAEDDARARELDLPGRKDVDGGVVAWQQVLGRRAIALFSAAGRVERGALESPERDVLVWRAGVLDVSPERLPDTRRRGAVAVRAARLVGHDASVHVGTQYDFDDWGLAAPSARLMAFRRFGSGTILRARLRAYTQNESRWFRPVAHADRDRSYTANAQMQGFTSWLGGLRWTWSSGDIPGPVTAVSGGLDVDLYYQTPRNEIEQGYFAPIVGGNVLFLW